MGYYIRYHGSKTRLTPTINPGISMFPPIVLQCGQWVGCDIHKVHPRIIHIFQALLCFLVVLHWSFYPYPSGLVHRHWAILWLPNACELILRDICKPFIWIHQKLWFKQEQTTKHIITLYILTVVVLNLEYSRTTRLIPWLLMPWHLACSGHKQLW